MSCSRVPTSTDPIEIPGPIRYQPSSGPLKCATPLNQISVTFCTTSEKAPIKSSRHTSHQTSDWAFFIQSLPNTRHINDSSPSQNLKRRQSYSQSKILQQSECNRRTKRPGNIEPDEDICHVHFNPNKIRRHPYEQKYCIIHSNSSLFRKTGSLSIAVSDFGSMNTIEHKVRALMFCCGTMCFSAVGIVPQQKSKSFYNPKITP